LPFKYIFTLLLSITAGAYALFIAFGISLSGGLSRKLQSSEIFELITVCSPFIYLLILIYSLHSTNSPKTFLKINLLSYVFALPIYWGIYLGLTNPYEKIVGGILLSITVAVHLGSWVHYHLLGIPSYQERVRKNPPPFIN
jgi:hypothetical protein